jgi:hypothetical protein
MKLSGPNWANGSEPTQESYAERVLENVLCLCMRGHSGDAGSERGQPGARVGPDKNGRKR